MKEEIIYIDKENGYLTGSIPVNAIIYKKITGIGATTLEIACKRNSIIIEPNTPVIEGKVKKYSNLLGVYEGITTNQIISYLQDSHISYKKIMTTPESFGKVKKAFNFLNINMYQDYFLLFDECHKLTSDISYRETITLPMADFWKFERRSLISATITNFTTYPIFQKYGFRNITIQPKWDHSLKVNLYSSNNILQDVKSYLETLPSKEEKVCFFINSIDIIISLIYALGINEDSNIYCANKSVGKLTHKGLSHIQPDINNLNHYNFYTSRYFSAVDIITDDKPHVVVISDAIKAPQTLIEPALESRQIAGRFRNGISSFTHIAGLDNKIRYKTTEELRTFMQEQRKAYIQLKTLYNSASEEGGRQVMKEAIERIEISKYMEEDNSFNYFMSENLLDAEATKSRYQNWENFILSYSLDEEFFEIIDQYNNQYEQDKDRIRISVSNSRLLRKEIVDQFFAAGLDNGAETEEQKALLEELQRQDEFIVEICQNFDKDFIIQKNYNKQQLTLALIKKQVKEQCLSFPVIDAVSKLFRIGFVYSEEEITSTLNKIYSELGIKREAKATDIKEYFETSPRRTVKQKGAFKKGYKLYEPKFTIRQQ
ncbi:hypothetical protein [Parabacteroides distasonis]|uniref:hypothetical protein n=1 Tax=Parabacteroides distasonis TaxID=823 RepID=UPI0028057C10|nr:hypothetical protein [Parabacteroides distasonis]WMI42571.1 hypothetical protein Q8809_21890 [Parabacteroides distasonis]